LLVSSWWSTRVAVEVILACQFRPRGHMDS
jgi:hypothetical protein